MAEAARRDLEQRGMAMKNMPVEPSWFTEQATRRVKLGLLLAELVKAKDLHAKPEQVRAIVDEFAETFEDPKEVVRWYYSQPQRLAEAEALAHGEQRGGLGPGQCQGQREGRSPLTN